ncbi:MAG: cell division protein FtsZ, partial [Bacteroidota bacterium]
GAKWILININSSEGDHEFTMDEVEIIQSYLISRAGEGTDVILGLGYDPALGSKIGITLIATGFEYKDPFTKPTVKKEEPKKEEKIVMTLETKKDEPAIIAKQFALPLDERAEEIADTTEKHPYKIAQVNDEPVSQLTTVTLKDSLLPTLVEEPLVAPVMVGNFTVDKTSKITVDNDVDSVEKKEEPTYMELVYSQPSAFSNPPAETFPAKKQIQTENIVNNSPASAVRGGYLAKPSNIYAEPRTADNSCLPDQMTPPVKLPVLQESPVQPSVQKEEEPSFDMQLVIKDEDSNKAADAPRALQTQQPEMFPAEDPAMLDEAEEQKRRAAERIQKLRNLSFNANAADTNNEFETVPAYIRRNLELYNTVSPAENFYSTYEVKADENNTGKISSLNTFLDGKKLD